MYSDFVILVVVVLLVVVVVVVVVVVIVLGGAQGEVGWRSRRFGRRCRDW